MPEGRRPRGVTPHQRSGAAAESAGCDGAGTAERSCPASKVRGGREEPPHAQGKGRAGRSYPTPEARDSREEPLHNQGAVAAPAQESLEELSKVEGQEGQR